MKQILLKFLIVITILLFLDWIIMIVVGCISNICGANATFFSTFYCYFGIILVILTFLFTVVALFKQHFHHGLNV